MDRRNAITTLLLVAPIVAVGFVNGFYNRYLLDDHPIVFWMADVVQYVVLPAGVLIILYVRVGVSPRDYGLAGPNPLYPGMEMAGAGLFSGIILTAVYFAAWYGVLAIAGDSEDTFSFALAVPDGIARPRHCCCGSGGRTRNCSRRCRPACRSNRPGSC